MSPTPPVIRVSVEKGKARKTVYSFSGPFRIGRDEECEVRLSDSKVSRFHAESAVRSGQVVADRSKKHQRHICRRRNYRQYRADRVHKGRIRPGRAGAFLFDPAGSNPTRKPIPSTSRLPNSGNTTSKSAPRRDRRRSHHDDQGCLRSTEKETEEKIFPDNRRPCLSGRFSGLLMRSRSILSPKNRRLWLKISSIP